MKMTQVTTLAIALLGLGLTSSTVAQDASKKAPAQPLKSVSCPPECGFMVRSHDEKELIEIVKAHAKKMHGKDLTDDEVRAMIKTAKSKEG